MWKPIKGYEGLYEVSDSGEIRSCPRYIKTGIRNVNKRLIKGRILRQNTKRTGYKTVDLCKDGKAITTQVHRVVAEAFCPNPKKLHFVNHIDSNRTNNKASNLEWVTSSENRMHGMVQGNVTFLEKSILCIENGEVFKRPQHAAEWIKANYPERINGKIRVAAQNIRAASKGIKHSAYGFTWKYPEGSTTIPKGSRAKRPEMGDPAKAGEDIV